MQVRWCSNGSSAVLLECLCEHQLSHPFNSVSTRVDGKMMASGFLEEFLVLLVFWNETEGEAWFFVGGTNTLLEGGVEL